MPVVVIEDVAPGKARGTVSNSTTSTVWKWTAKRTFGEQTIKLVGDVKRYGNASRRGWVLASKEVERQLRRHQGFCTPRAVPFFRVEPEDILGKPGEGINPIEQQAYEEGLANIERRRQADEKLDRIRANGFELLAGLKFMVALATREELEYQKCNELRVLISQIEQQHEDADAHSG